MIRTCYGQTLQVGDQVAYVRPLETRIGGWGHIETTGGDLRVARIAAIESRPGFAEADEYVTLTLDDGEKVNVLDVAKTDGEFQYAR